MSSASVIKTTEYKRWRRRLRQGEKRLNRFSRLRLWAERKRCESFKNTRLYCRFWLLCSIAYIVVYLATKNYYNGWYSALCSFFDISIFPKMRADWTLAFEILKLLLQLLLIFFFIKSIISLFRKGIKPKRIEKTYRAQQFCYMENQHSVCCTGPPGAGKTSLGGDMAVAVAERRWLDLQFEYHTRKRQVQSYVKMGQIEEYEKFKAIEESYLFFKKNEWRFIPCLATTLGMRVGGRYSYIANNKFYLQMQRIPEYCVIFDDESGSTKGANTSSAVADNVADFYRYVRHYGDYMIIMTEQGDDGTGKYIRKCLDNTIYCKGQKWVLKPEFLLRRFEKMRYKLIRREEKGVCNPRYNTFVYYFGAIIRTIGWREISYRDLGNIEHDDNGVVGKKGTKYYLPSRLVYDYDDRAYRFTYKALNMPLKLDGWDRLTLRPQDDLRNFSVIKGNEEKQTKTETKKAV